MIRDAIRGDEACVCLLYRTVTCVHVQRLCSDGSSSAWSPHWLLVSRCCRTLNPVLTSTLLSNCKTSQTTPTSRSRGSCWVEEAASESKRRRLSILGMLNLSAGQMCVLFVYCPVLIGCLTVTIWIFISAGSVHKDVGNRCFSLAH